MTSIDEVRQSIKSLSETQKKLSEAQEKGRQTLEKILKELSESQKKLSEGLSESQKKLSEGLSESKKELSESQKKLSEELSESKKELSESQKKLSEALSKSKKEFLESRKETDKKMNQILGEWDNQWGKFVEQLVDSGVISLLEGRGIKVQESSMRVRDRSPNRRWEIDILAVNGEEIVAIEVKKKLRKKDVKEAIEDFKMFQQDSKQCRGKTLYGAVAYLECEPKVDQYAEQLGLFVFQATGNSAKLINKPHFRPQAFPLSATSR